MRWFRFYDDAINDPKVQRLSPHLFKTWINLLCLASKSGGKLPSDDDVAFLLRSSIQDAAQQVEDLILAGLIDIGPRGERTPHNWSNRQFASDSSAERVRKHRQNKKEKPCNVTRNAKVTLQTQNQNREESLSSSSSLVAARETMEEPKIDSGFDKGKINEDIIRRAEGLGLPFEDLITTTKARKPDNHSAYFTTLCVNSLKPYRIAEKLVRSGLWGNNEAYGELVKAVSERSLCAVKR